MSAAPKFSIAVQVGEADQSHLWDSAEALSLGHSLPWILERPADEVRLVHASSGSVFPLDQSLLKKGTEIELQQPENQSGLAVVLRIREVPELEPIHHNRAEEGSATVRWHVFALSGGWVLDSWPLGNRFRGTRNHRTAFVIQERDGRYHAKIKDPEVRLESLTGSAAPTPDSRGIYVLTPEQLARVQFATDATAWRFNLVEQRAATSLRLVEPPADEETRWFRRSLTAFALMFLFLFGTTLLLVKPAEEEKKEEVQYARIVLPRSMKKSERTEPAAPAPQDAGGNAPQAEPVAVAEKTPAPPKGESKPDAPKQTVAQNKAESAPDNRSAGAVGKAAPAKAIARAKTDTNQAAAAPAKPKVSKAVLQAQALQNSMAKLMGGVPTSLLAASGNGGRVQPTQGVFSGKSESLGAASDGTLAKAGLGGSGHQVVKVGYTGDGSGSPDGKSVAGYGSGVPGGIGVKGGQGSFVSVAISEGGATTDNDGLTKKEIYAVISRHMSEVRHCYDRALIRRPNVEGKLFLDWMIRADGRVSNVSVKSSSLGDRELDNCIATRLATWQFPRPRGNIDMRVEFPFGFGRL